MSPLKKSSLILFLLFSVNLLFGYSLADARCGGSFLNPITDVSWKNIFPVRIAGVRFGKSLGTEPPDPASKVICFCPAPPPIYRRVGIPVAFWEPARFIETVSEPWCFPSLGSKFGGSSGKGALHGSQSEWGNIDDASTFAQAHLFIFAPWALMEMLTDFVCVEHSGFDLAYVTELDPMWQDDELNFLIQPEALLFANPIAQFSCAADSVATNAGVPLTPLFHCVGSGGSIYPLTGYVNDPDYVQANQTVASRMIFKLGRQMQLFDTGVNLCAAVPTPIWVKWNYRLQIAKPVRGSLAQPPGRTALIWGSAKNPPIGAKANDNFLFMLFRKRACCAF